jgi:hypothetical protein
MHKTVTPRSYCDTTAAAKALLIQPLQTTSHACAIAPRAVPIVHLGILHF